VKFLFAIINFISRFEKSRKWLGWLVAILVVLQSVLMWFSKKEYKLFSDCLFHNRKQASHPWIGERAIEYPWAYKNISDLKNGKIMDVGAKEGLPITDMLLENQNIVYAIDLNAVATHQNGNLIIAKGDIISTTFEDNFFDSVIVISTLEHIGVAGRYGISVANETGDFQAMSEIFRVLKPGGKVLVTVPYGMGKSLPLNRLYDAERTKKLFTNFEITQSQYFIFHPEYELWLEADEEKASKNNWDNNQWYALACFCANKPMAL
jgi:SAM-dependent methyltransferase